MSLIKSAATLFGYARTGLFVWLTWDVPHHVWWIIAFVTCNFVCSSILEYRIDEARKGRV